MVERGTDRERVGVGDPTRRRDHYHIDLIRLDDGWHYRRDYSYGMGGGGGPYGREAFATRDDALTDALRDLVKALARDAATDNKGYPPAWLDWAINIAPSPLFGGADLSDEYQEMLIRYRKRNALRCAAIRAAGDDYANACYVDESGSVRSIYSL